MAYNRSGGVAVIVRHNAGVPERQRVSVLPHWVDAAAVSSLQILNAARLILCAEPHSNSNL